MLSNILSAAVISRIVTELPDERIAPYGGPWGQRVPDVPATYDELIEYDRNIPPAADIIAQGAQSRDVVNLPTELVQHRAVRVKSSSSLTTSELQVIMRLAETSGASATDRQGLLGIARKHITNRRQSVAITRGILIAGMACGELNYDRRGFKTGTLDFSMPASLKVTPAVYWISNTGTAQTTATPIDNFTALDLAAQNLGGAPYDHVDMSLAAFNAMIGTTQYQNQAKALSSVYQAGSLPVAGSAQAVMLAERVIGKTILITDNYFEWEDGAGVRTTGRYLPSKYVVLSRKADHGSGISYDVANVPVTESAVAAIAGAPAFGGGVVRGPVDYMTYDSQNYAWVRMHATQECIPRRHSRTATARILVEEPA